MSAVTLSGDSKTAQRVTRDASKVRVRVPNAFGLPAGESCPGATPACLAVCYAARAETRPSTRQAMARNFAALRACADDVDALAGVLRPAMVTFAAQAARAGIDRPTFRVHWDGDYYSEAYAQAWRVIMAEHPAVQFWAYTRSIGPDVDVVPILASVPNLTLYVSVDRDNIDRAAVVLARHPTVHAAVMAPTATDVQALRDQLARGRAPICPELTGRLALVVPESRRGTLAVGAKGMGACAACRLCPDGIADVGFPTSRKRAA